ncbi:MAG: arsenite efflux transporter metallochaperone ArsD [Clostridium lundense]|nr:arsenite efflux transporter metallochaperone ArsD [Clostridium lundense]
MKKMVIFDPAMCCSTGVCGPSVDPELLRMSTALNTLQKKGVVIDRYNLTSNPQAFVDNKLINDLLNSKGVDILPVTMVDGEVVKTKAYPSNKELCQMLDIPEDYLAVKKPLNIKIKTSSSGCCGGDGCC